MLIPVFTVAENVELGHERTRFGFLNRRRRPPRGARGLRALRPAGAGRRAGPGPPGGCPAARRDHQGADPRRQVLILDEPTAVLTPQETDDLMDIMRSLKEGGTSIVFITHKLREVRAVADRITVIRRGKVVGEASPTVVVGRAGLDDGRPAGAARDREGAAQAGRGDPRGRPTCGSSTPPARSPSTTSASRCAAARSMPWPASRATGRPSSPRPWSGWRTSSPARSRSRATTSPGPGSTP